jgi:hypothetical protein
VPQGAQVAVRDIWAGEDQAAVRGTISRPVCAHCTVVLKLRLADGGRIDFQPWAHQLPAVIPFSMKLDDGNARVDDYQRGIQFLGKGMEGAFAYDDPRALQSLKNLAATEQRLRNAPTTHGGIY